MIVPVREAALLPGETALVGGSVGRALWRRGRPHGVLDWAGVRIGDPARDLMAAWTLLRGEARRRFRASMPFDDDTWARAHGCALTRITNVAYAPRPTPRFSADAVATITEARADPI